MKISKRANPAYKKYINTYNWAKKRSARIQRRMTMPEGSIEAQNIIKKFTGWQRNQWVKAGRPLDKLEWFSKLTKNKHLNTIKEETHLNSLTEELADDNDGRKVARGTSIADMLLRSTKNS